MMHSIDVRVICGMLAAALAVVSTGCGEERITFPESLQAPVSMDVADGQVCLPEITGDTATVSRGALPACDEEGNGFGLVANQRSGKVSVVALGQREHRVANLDTGRPGISSIRVGDRPVDVTTSGQGTAAVAASEADETLTGIDLWTLQPLDEPRELEGTPRRVDTIERGDESTRLVTLTTGPDRLELSGGLRCERPDADDRLAHDPQQSCQWEDVDAESLDLPARPVDMAVDESAGRGWVAYRGFDELSWIAFDDEALGDDECLGGQTPPCEIERVGWQRQPDAIAGGVTAVEAGPLGLFVVVLDRPNSELLVFDRNRRQLVEAAEAMEPPAPGQATSPGIPLRRSPTAVGFDVERHFIDDGHVQYRFGAQVAANDGGLYRVDIADVECLFDATGTISDEEFLFAPEVRARTGESECLEHLPEFPLGADPDFDDEQQLLERRVVEPEEADVQLAITPVFGLRDADERDSHIRRASCERPEEFQQALGEAANGAEAGCGSPLAPQPVGIGVDDQPDGFEAEHRAELVSFAAAWFDEDRQPMIGWSVDDRRVVDEQWTVGYEHPLPEPGGSAAALVSAEQEGLFISGSTDYCSAGVEVGDRLTILTDPADEQGCEVFDTDDPEQRSWRIGEVRAFELQLEVLDGDQTVDELPTRECFDQGLNYEVRPVEAWTVFGDNSGVSSPYESDGDECVLREGADEPRFRRQARVETGQEFWGLYLNFRIRQGEVEPVRGLEYTFETQRSFAPESISHVPDRGGDTMPSQVDVIPDLGVGWLVTVVDAGGDRVFVRNLSDADVRDQFVR